MLEIGDELYFPLQEEASFLSSLIFWLVVFFEVGRCR